MTWATLGDDFPDHPKIIRLSPAAFRLEVASICYANRLLTDGVILSEAVPKLGGTKRVVDELLRVRLWETHPDGYVIHDFLDHNWSRAQVEERRAELSGKRAEAGRKGGFAKAANAAKLASNGPSKTPSKNVANPGPIPIPIPIGDGSPVATIPPVKPKRLYRDVDEEYLNELQAAHAGVNVRAIYATAQNRKTWAGYTDKRHALRDRIRFAEEDHRNASTPLRQGHKASNGTLGSDWFERNKQHLTPAELADAERDRARG